MQVRITVMRWFSRVYFQTVPDKSTLIRWGNPLQPETLHQLNDRVVELARQAKVTKGRKLRASRSAHVSREWARWARERGAGVTVRRVQHFIPACYKLYLVAQFVGSKERQPSEPSAKSYQIRLDSVYTNGMGR